MDQGQDQSGRQDDVQPDCPTMDGNQVTPEQTALASVASALPADLEPTDPTRLLYSIGSPWSDEPITATPQTSASGPTPPEGSLYPAAAPTPNAHVPHVAHRALRVISLVVYFAILIAIVAASSNSPSETNLDNQINGTTGVRPPVASPQVASSPVASPPPPAEIAPIVSPPTVPSTTTIACPPGSPTATTTISGLSDPGTGGFRVLTGTATVADDMNVPVVIQGAELQVVDASGTNLEPVALSPLSGVPITLNPGQSTSLTNGGALSIPAPSQPRISSFKVRWNWPLDSPYLSCPNGLG